MTKLVEWPVVASVLPVLYSQTHLDKHDEVGRVACCGQRATGAVLTNSP